jgi:hypothetical protein
MVVMIRTTRHQKNKASPVTETGNPSIFKRKARRQQALK